MKKAISILLAAAMGAAALTGCSKSSGSSSSGNTPLVLNEVAHSIFYAPQYAAIELGYFEDEGIYVYQEGSQDYAVNFAQLTQRAGNFLVGRQPEDNFKWESLKGKKVLGGRAGGMPQMVFEYILKKHGMDPKDRPFH